MYVSKFLVSHLQNTRKKFAVLCIGTDRSTGDSYGPLTGTLLTQRRLQVFDVHGTLSHPVHALNLQEKIHSIYNLNPDTLIIAIDASLGQNESIGNLVYGIGSIAPGKAVKKDLPLVGDLFITSIVNIAGFMEYSTLQSTRLSLVYSMAQKTAQIIQMTDYYLSKHANVSMSNTNSH